MKLSSLFMIVVAIQFSIMLFASGNSYTNCTPGGNALNSTSGCTAIFGFINNPTNWSNTYLVAAVLALMAGVAFTGSFVGTFLFGKQDLMVFGFVVSGFATCMVPIASLWQLIYEQSSMLGNNGISAFIASVVTAPLLIIAIFTLLGWWRGNSDM